MPAGVARYQSQNPAALDARIQRLLVAPYGYRRAGTTCLCSFPSL